jgi:hypothetical protein
MRDGVSRYISASDFHASGMTSLQISCYYNDFAFNNGLRACITLRSCKIFRAPGNAMCICCPVQTLPVTYRPPPRAGMAWRDFRPIIES